MLPGNVETRAGVAALLTVAWALLMLLVRSYPFPHVFPHDVGAPVLALELAHSAGDIDAVLHRSEPGKAEKAAHGMWSDTMLDLVFIPLYAFFLWSLVRVFTQHARLLTALILGAALCDYLEDWQIFRAIKGENPAIYIPSLVKWGLLGLVLLGTAVILLRSASPVYALATKRLLAIAYLVSGALFAFAVFFGDWIGYSLIELGMNLFALLVVTHIVGLLGHYLAIPGRTPTYVENFCEERKKTGMESLRAVKQERIS